MQNTHPQTSSNINNFSWQSLKTKMGIFLASLAIVIITLVLWGIQSLEQVDKHNKAATDSIITFHKQIDELKRIHNDRQLAFNNLRQSYKQQDEQIINLNKLNGYSQLFDKQLNSYLESITNGFPNDLDNPLEEIKRRSQVYSAALNVVRDTLISGNLLAADRMANTSLIQEFLGLDQSLDQLKQKQLTKQNKALIEATDIASSHKTTGIILLFVALILACFIPVLLFAKPLYQVTEIQNVLEKLKQGEISNHKLTVSNDEIGAIAAGINKVIDNLQQASLFANDIGQGKFETIYNEASERDMLGAALVEMRNRLKAVSEEEARRNWAITGAAQFGEILRANTDLSTFADQIISNLTRYIGAIQGGFFIASEQETGAIELSLLSSYAYERKKYINKSFRLGEGLVGQAALEKGTIYITEIPGNYITITSGLGEAPPKSILVVPLISNQRLYGALEFAAFNVFEKYVIEFVEKLGESIASTLTFVRSNEQTIKLLQETQTMAKALQSNEMELRQNMEKLTATYQEMNAVQLELQGQINAINHAAIVSETDLKGVITFVNDEFCRVTGYTSQELLGKSHRLLKSTRHLPALFQTMWSTITSGQVWKGELCNIRKDGSEYWVNATITPVLDAEFKLIKFISIQFDVTYQKEQALIIAQALEQSQAKEEELRKNAEEMAATQEEMRRIQIELNGQVSAVNNAAIVSETDLLGNITYANNEFCRIAKYQREELMGNNHRILKSGHQPDEIFIELWQTISKGLVWRGLIKNKAKDGTYYWVNATITPVLGLDGKPVKYIGVRFEVTEQIKQRELISQQLEEAQAQEEEIRQNAEELEATNEEMRRIQIELNGQVNAVNNAAIVSEADLAGNIIYVNDEFCRIAKYQRDELMGNNHRMLKSGHQPDEIFIELWQTISKGQVWRGLIKNKAKDGSFYWVKSTITPVLGNDGKPIKYIGVRFEVTEQILQSEQIALALEEAQAQEEEIRQNAEELEATNEEMRRIQIELNGQVNAVNNAAIVSEADLAGNIIYVNDEFCRIAKYQRDELMGNNHRMLKSGHQPDEIFIELWQTISKGQVWRGLIKNKAKDGSFYWVKSTITPVLGNDGKPIKYIGVRFEVTEQILQSEQIALALEEAQAQEEEIRQNAEELEATNEEMRRIQIELNGQVNAVNNAAIVSEADLAGNIIYVNDEFCRIAKYQRDELMGNNHRMLKSGHQPDEIFIELWQTISKGQVWRGLIKNKAKDGSFYWVKSTITPVLGNDGKPIKYIGVRFEVTEQILQSEQIALALEEAQAQEEEIRQNAEELEATNEEMRRIQIELNGQINALNFAAIVSEADVLGNILYVNEQFTKVSKYSRDELIGQNHRILKSGHQPQELFDNLWQTISSGQSWRGLIKNKAKDGSYYWVQSFISPVLGIDGKPIKYIGVRFEVTDQILQEQKLKDALAYSETQAEEIRRSAGLLQQTLQEIELLQIELEGEITALSRANAAIEFDLEGNILNANQAFCEMMRYRIDELLNNNHKLFLNKVEADSKNHALMWASLRDGNFLQIEAERIIKFGDSILLNSTYIPIIGINGKPIKVLMIAENVTTRKSLHIDTQSNTLREKVYGDNSSVGLVLMNRHGLIESVNQLICNLLGYEKEELIGKPLSNLISDNERGSYQKALEAFLNQNGSTQINVEVRFTHKTGKILTVKLQTAFIRGVDGHAKCLSFIIDVTQKKINDLEIGVQIKFLQLSNAILEIDERANILSANDNFLNSSGFEIKDLVGQPFSVILDQSIHTVAKQDELWLKLKSGQPVKHVFKCKSKSGNDLWLNATINPILGTDDKLTKVLLFSQDITAQKMAELELERKINAIYRTNAVIEYDLEGNILSANQTFCNLFGYTLEELVGLNHSIFINRTYAQSSEYKAFWLSLKQGKLETGEYQRLKKSGEIIWVLGSYNPVLNNNNVPYKIINIAQNITKQKTIEIQSTYNYERAETLYNLAPLGIYITSEQGVIEAINPTLQRMLEVDANELIGQNFTQIYPPSVRPHVFEALKTNFVSSNGKFSKTQMQTKSGKSFAVHQEAGHINGSDGKPRKIIFVLDTSENATASSTQKYALELTQTLLKNSPIAICSTDHNGLILSCNPAMEKLLGFTAEELEGKVFSALAPANNVKALNERLSQLISNETVNRMDTVLTNHKKQPLSITLESILLNTQDNSKQIVHFLVDNTEKKKALSQLKTQEMLNEVLQNSSPVMIITSNDEGVIEQVNPAFCQTIGINEEDIVGKYLWDFTTKDKVKLWIDQNSRFFEEDSEIRGESVLLGKGKKVLSVVIDTARITDISGQAKRITYLIDVTERKRLQSEAQKQGSLATLLYEQSPIGLMILSNDGIIESCNAKLSALLQCTEDELIGQPLESYIGIDKHKPLQQRFESLNNGEDRTTLDVKLISKRGIPLPFRLDLTVNNNQIVAFFTQKVETNAKPTVQAELD